jgi:ABC-type multidrug transport system fused ATPase/permease subunit
VFFLFSRRASTVLHNRALGAVLRAPLSFFHSHPHGRILNKFGKDLDFLDDLLPITMYEPLIYNHSTG